MSLVHDALRKARREAGEEELRGLVYAHGLTGRRRSAGVGRAIVVGAVLALLIGAVVGGVLWLVPSFGPRAPARAVAGEPAPHQLPGRTPGAPSGAPPQQPPADLSAPPDTPNDLATEKIEAGAAPRAGLAGSADHEPAAGSREPREAAVRARTPLPRPTHPAQGAAASGERVFDVDADLGYAVLTLDYIAYRATDPFAQINGVDVRVGSTIEGFTVEDIGPSSVRLRDAHGPLVLRVP